MTHIDEALTHLAKHDLTIAELIDRHDIPSFTKHDDYYQELVESIIGQQLSVKAARTIRSRFVELFGDKFPTPEEILAHDIEELRSVGLSRPKASYIQDLALKVIEGEIKFDELDSLSNEEIISELTRVKGIGVWTVHMFLIFCMGRLDILPTGDLGIRNGIVQLYQLDHLPDPHEIELLAEVNGWQPYASVASWYIWQSIDNMPA
ncbi:MAG: DNA-3-methyladenine glycosylase family protein [Acidobacteriota bacterium]